MSAKLRCSLLLAGALLLGCSSKRHSPTLAPLTNSSWSLQLPVKGFGPATVALPLGATSPRPIVVVLHGARDRAEWQCGTFRGLLGGKTFIVCPRGMALGDGRFGLGSFDESEAELRAALAALKARFGRHVAPGPILLVGYAEGAAVAIDLARQEPSFFARLLLVRGEPSAFSPSKVGVFAERGGKRVLFFCTDQPCYDQATARSLLLQRASVSARAAQAAVGPYLDPPFVDAIRAELPWLLESDSKPSPAAKK